MRSLRLQRAMLDKGSSGMLKALLAMLRMCDLF